MAPAKGHDRPLAESPGRSSLRSPAAGRKDPILGLTPVEESADMSGLSHRRHRASDQMRGKRIRPRLEWLEDRILLAVNPIVAENQLPGTPPSQWQIDGAGDSTIQ